MRPALFLSESEITENFIIIHIKKDFLCGREKYRALAYLRII